MKGKFIVIYGIYNLGKTTQAKMLVNRLNNAGYQSEYLKYPIYNLEPSGPIIDNFLRGGNTYNLTNQDAQFIYALNRMQYEKILRTKLESGINIIAEDYIGTGLAWGLGSGVDENFLNNINKHLLKEDLAFLFDGERFTEAIESGHKHENDHQLILKVKQIHLNLAEKFGWIKVNANASINEIHEKLWQKTIQLIDHEYLNKKFILNQNDNQLKYSPDFKFLYEKTTIKLIIERLNAQAKLPTRAHASDAGLDLYTTDYYSLLPQERTLIKTGIAIIIPNGYAGFIWDKSSLAKNGLHITAGVIDSGYRGEILISAINLSQDIIHIVAGQKIAQIIIQKIENLDIYEEKINITTERGVDGFGSTGIF